MPPQGCKKSSRLNSITIVLKMFRLTEVFILSGKVVNKIGPRTNTEFLETAKEKLSGFEWFLFLVWYILLLFKQCHVDILVIENYSVINNQRSRRKVKTPSNRKCYLQLSLESH